MIVKIFYDGKNSRRRLEKNKKKTKRKKERENTLMEVHYANPTEDTPTHLIT